MPKQLCINCRFGESWNSESGLAGICRRQPPQVVVLNETPETDGTETEAFWPTFDDTDWCGEWRPKRED
jgi:hypothetical protein